MSEIVKGFKAFNQNLQCRGMQYEIGKEYTMDESPIPCQRGYHFCKSVSDCYYFYDMSENTRICEIEAFGEVATDDEVKYCTNGIRIVAEIENPREASNSGSSNSGYRNSGDRNSGDRNSGDWNSGDWNSGDRNSGDWNSGYRNSGDWNSGDWNSGDWNSGYRNSGVFCTAKNPKIKFFDKDSDWTYDDWINCGARYVMAKCPYSYSDFINTEDMTDEEKENHPEYKTIGGYIKVITVTDSDKQTWWDKLSEDDKKKVYALPNFNAEKFKSCTGIEVEHE